MVQFATSFSRSRSADQAAEELWAAVETVLGGRDRMGGGFLFATAASGSAGREVGEALAARWPSATLLGSSFEGVLAEGRAWRDVPALGLMAWTEGPDEPIPVFLAPGAYEAGALSQELLEAMGRPSAGADDLLLLFPDSLMGDGLEPRLAELANALGEPSIAGAAACGLGGAGCQAWIGEEVVPSATVGLLIPGAAGEIRDQDRPGHRVRCAGATRFASPWLEISACRERWVDGLDGEPPLDWVRRQLGLEPGSPVEPHLERLLVRLRNLPSGAHPPPQEVTPGEPEDGDLWEFVERFVIGVDDRRGSMSLPGDFSQGGYLALALPDADRARSALRAAVRALRPSPLVMHFACRARDEALHGDPDLEPALVAHHAEGRGAIGTLGPFQLGPDSRGAGRMLVYSSVLAALGDA